MIGKVNSVFISLAFIIVSVLLSVYSYYNFDNLSYSSPIPTISIVLFTLVFPVLLHICYLNSGFNKIIAFIIALLTSIICYYVCHFTYCLKMDFNEYYVKSAGITTGLFIFSQIIIGLIFAIIYFVIWWKQRKP